MELFTSPGWDDGNACEKLNKQLFESAAETSAALSDKKSRKAAKKLAKSEKTRLSAKNQLDTSASTTHVDTLKKDLLSELKCKFANKRKQSFCESEKEITSPQPIKRKKVTFSNEAEVVLIDSTKPVHVSPKKKKKPSTTTNNDLESDSITAPSTFSLSTLLSKLSKKLDKIDKNELENGNEKAKVLSNGFNDQSTSKKGKIKKRKKDSVFLEHDIAVPDPIPSNINSSSPESKKLKKKTKKLIASNERAADEGNNDNLVAKEGKPCKSKRKMRKEKKKLARRTAMDETSSDQKEEIVPKYSVAKNSGLSAMKLSNAAQLKLMQSLASADQSPLPSPSPRKLAEQDVVARRSPATLRERMMRKLHASRFRYLNEQMYLSKGNESLAYFKTDPQAFQAYHQGYRQQVEQWPLNPLDKIITMLKKKPQLVVADFGCGDARLARSIPNKVHSFDLVAMSELVTACDMAHTPLGNGSMDVAVFCLSLMGTNLEDYLKEANRVLKDGGNLKIAEVESRFEDVEGFIKNVQQYGFNVVSKDLSHDLFYFMDFHKTENIKKESKKGSKKAHVSSLPSLSLKPCYYKKR